MATETPSTKAKTYDSVSRSRYKATRRETRLVAATGKTRKGPLPIEDDVISEAVKNRPGRIVDAVGAEVDITHFGAAGNVALLGFFARLATSTDNEVDVEYLHSLKRAGANYDFPDLYGQTALHAAVRDWHPDVAKYLLDNGASAGVCDKFGRTPMHLAAAVDYPEMIELLYKHGGMLILLE